MADDNIESAVHDAVAEALGLDEDEVTGDATLLDELGAESIDLLDILFRLERRFGVKIQASDLADYVQGGIPDDVFSDDDDVITTTGMAHLQKVMPQVDESLLGELRAEDVMNHFTVDNLVTLVEQRVATADA